MGSSRLKVLIVDDSSIFRTFLSSALLHRVPDLEILTAEGVSDGLPMARREKPEWAVVDVQLQDGNGLRLAEDLKREFPRLVVAICTGYDAPEYREAATELGARYFLSKDGMFSVGTWDRFVEALERDARNPPARSSRAEEPDDARPHKPTEP